MADRKRSNGRCLLCHVDHGVECEPWCPVSGGPGEVPYWRARAERSELERDAARASRREVVAAYELRWQERQEAVAKRNLARFMSSGWRRLAVERIAAHEECELARDAATRRRLDDNRGWIGALMPMIGACADRGRKIDGPGAADAVRVVLAMLAEAEAQASHFRGIYESAERAHAEECGRRMTEQAAHAATNATLDACRREADRLRHGVPVEGDFVCPDALALDAETRAGVALAHAANKMLDALSPCECCEPPDITPAVDALQRAVEDYAATREPAATASGDVAGDGIPASAIASWEASLRREGVVAAPVTAGEARGYVTYKDDLGATYTRSETDDELRARLTAKRGPSGGGSRS